MGLWVPNGNFMSSPLTSPGSPSSNLGMRVKNARPGEVYEYNKVTHVGLSLYEHMPSRMPAQAAGLKCGVWCDWDILIYSHGRPIGRKPSAYYRGKKVQIHPFFDLYYFPLA